MNIINRFYQKWYLVIGGLAIAAGLLICMILVGRMTQETSLQKGIADEIIRFHVIANSDSDEDQALKMKVKNEVVAYMETILKDAHSIDATRTSIKENMDKIQKKAVEIINREGYAYPAKASLTWCYFPIKSYGDITFPAGDYEALRIQIGEAEGKNWWCVLYPNLCFIDSIHAVVPEDEKEELKNVLTEDEYDSLFSWKKSEYKIGWKYLPF